MMTEPATAPPRFVNPASLLKSVPLEHPVVFDGTTYAEIHLKKMTAGEVAAFIKSFAEIRKADPDATPRFPIFVDQAGQPLPQELLEGLEADDFDTVDQAAAAFLPRRFRPEPATTEAGQAGSTPSTGETGAPSSSA